MPGAGRAGLCAPGRCVLRGPGRLDVRGHDRALRHHRHPGQQRRPAARCRLCLDDARAMEYRHQHQSHRAVPVRARGHRRVPAPRRGAGGVARCRQDHLHEQRAPADSLGGACQLRGLQGRHQAADGIARTGSGPASHPRQRHRARRHPHAHQHRGLEHACRLCRAHEAGALWSHRRARGHRARGRVARLGSIRLCGRHHSVRRWRHDGSTPDSPPAAEPRSWARRSPTPASHRARAGAAWQRPQSV